MTRRDDELRLEAIGRGLGGWLLGLGLLRFHLVVFALGAVGLLLLNLYRSPADLWAAERLRVWAIVLGCHAAALLTGWATWRAVRPHRLPPVSALPASSAPPAAVPAAMGPAFDPRVPPGAGANGHAHVAGLNGAAELLGPEPAPTTDQPPTVAGLPARGRFSPPPSEPPPVGRAAASRGAVDEAAATLRSLVDEGIAAGRTGWRRLAAATQSGLDAIAARLSGANEVPEGNASPPMPGDAELQPGDGRPSTTPGWPAPPIEPDAPPGWEHVVRPPVQATPAGAAPGPTSGWPAPPPAVTSPAAGQWSPGPAAGPDPAGTTGAGHSRPAAPEPGEGADGPPLKAETEWTWMEAAAASWLARNGDDEPNPDEPGSDPAPRN